MTTTEGPRGQQPSAGAGQRAASAAAGAPGMDAQAAAPASEELLRLVLDNTTDIIASVGPDDRMRWISPSLTRLLGWRTDEWIGRRSVEFMHPDDAPAAASAIGQTLERGEETRFTARLRTPAGDWRPLEIDTRPVRDEAGTVVGRVSSARDVTDREAAQEALGASEAQLRVVLEHAS